jgi:ATP-dependent Clp protease, protease subunit
MLTVPVVPKPPVHAVFIGQIAEVSAARIATAFGTISGAGVAEVHLAFQSTGGYVGDGVFLYNLFRAAPFGLTLYNVGMVQSIATVAFLGARHRKASAYAQFMIHRTTRDEARANAASTKAAAQTLALDDERTEAILRSQANLPEDRWRDLDYRDLLFNAKEALEWGFVDEIADFRPPYGQPLPSL